MSTLPPSMRRTPAKAPVSSVKMATTKTAKAKTTTTMKASATDGVSKTKTQMHRRSRSGTWIPPPSAASTYTGMDSTAHICLHIPPFQKAQSINTFE